PSEGSLFTPVTGIDFANIIPENDSVNIIVFEYIYNGGGVGVGDFDQDGNPDLVFSGNYVSSRLYLQKSSWDFTDITAAAGLTTEVWCSGVNVADVDGNGWEDIYFATLNPSGEKDTPNLLYLNQGVNADGIPTFVEAAAEYGLDDRSYGTHSAWFDYENDGDLDLYLLNNAIEQYNRNVAKGTDTTGRGKSVDRIYRNENNRFTGTEEIQTEGWGLGVAVQDFNFDGFADLYVANDFLSNDFLLMNQDGKGFRDELRERLPHQSRNSMGVDVADLTGDGQPEIMVVDMLPDDNRRVKTMFGDIPHQGDRTERQRGYAQQYIRNTLQLNNGDGTFSDIAFQAGVAATDWSWTPLLADFDNDGDRDIYVSNGYPKDITNKDFIDFSDQATQFGTRESQLKTVMEALAKVEGVHQPNYFFRNDGELQFTEADWLPEEPTYSNGSVFVDLDRDGDLDLVTNNINEPAGLYRNNLRERASGS
ncbi:MAG: VCBS repeat-containing protein, partial [Bacteroidota bacterium]